MQIRFRNKPILAVLLLSLTLTGCSTIKIGYYFADNLIIERAENFLDWQYSEKNEASLFVQQMMSWHRQTMLAQYANFLEEKALVAENGNWSKDQVELAFSEFRFLLQDTIKGITPFAANVLMPHTQKDKLAYLENRLNEAFEERLEDEKLETREQSIEEWVERQTRNLERFTGSLNDKQIAIIRDYAPRDAFIGMRWLETRKLRQEAFIIFMARQPQTDELSKFLTTLFLNPHEIVDPDYQSISEGRWQIRVELYTDILNTLDQTQTKNLVENLNAYAQDLRELAAQASS